MKKDILFCSRDRDYLDALLGYLAQNDSLTFLDFDMYGINSLEEFISTTGKFSLAFLESEFLESYEKNSSLQDLRIDKVYLFSDELINNENTSVFFKYQNMDALISLIKTEIGRDSNLGHTGSGYTDIVGIYSPGKNELALPYSIALSRNLSKSKTTILLDVSEISIIDIFIDQETRGDVIDAIYLLENQSPCDILGEFILDLEGTSILTPSRIPSQISYISLEQWRLLLDGLREYGFETVVIYFGNLIQGFSELCRDFKKLILLRNQGSLSTLFENNFQEYLRRIEMNCDLEEVDIPFSISNQIISSNNFDALINGKLMQIVGQR